MPLGQVSHHGVMMKRAGFNPDWQERFFTLQDGELSYFKPGDVFEPNGKWKKDWRKTAPKQARLLLQGATLELSLSDATQMVIRCAGVEGRSPSKASGQASSLAVRCESEGSRNVWFAKLKSAIDSHAHAAAATRSLSFLPAPAYLCPPPV